VDDPALTSPVLAVAGLRLSRGDRPVLRGVDLVVRRGERVALMGLSGGGKTTVLRTIVALDGFDEGRIDLDGVTLRPGPPPRESRLRALRRHVGLVFQSHHLFAHLSALDNVTLALLHVFKMSHAAADARALALLDSLGVGARAHARPSELSGGEAQRVAIARALAVDPPMLLLDEPTASLDPARRGELGEALVALAATGRTLVIATHDVPFARGVATRAVILADGQVVEAGPPDHVLTDPAHPATRAFLRAPG
jgi:ABC-type polar amino acid transport system ATPase subunit